MTVNPIDRGFRITNPLIESVIVRGKYRTERADVAALEVVVVNGSPADYTITELPDHILIELAGVVNRAPAASSADRVQGRDFKGGVNFGDLSNVQAQVPEVLIRLPETSSIMVMPL